MNGNIETFYWLFSSLSQSLAAILGLLMLGYMFIMEKLKSQEETLQDFYEEKKKYFYSKLKILITLFLLALSLNIIGLILINSNPYISLDLELRWVVADMIVLLSVLCFVSASIFVLEVVNPNTDRKIAEELMEREKMRIIKGERRKETVDAFNFIENWIEIERLLDRIVELKSLEERKSKYFFNQPKILLEEKIIDKSTAEKIEILRKIRNVVVHGKAIKVDKEFMDLSTEVINSLKIISK